MNDNNKELNKKWQNIADEIEYLDTKDSEEVVPAKDITEEGEDDDGEGASSGELSHSSYKALEDQLTAMEVKVHENWDKATRAVAELENVRRRAERDLESAHKYGVEKIIKELLPVVDSLEQALQIEAKSDETVKNIHEGIDLTLKLLFGMLQKFAVQPIDPIGEPFDPKLHEAMSTQVDPDVEPGTVLLVFQKGYLLHDRVIRPARVIVAKG